MDVSSRLSDLTAPTGTETQLDVSYPRFRVEPRHAAIAVAALALLLAGWYFLRPQPTAAPPVPMAAAPSSSAQIVVSVVGEVNQPGLATLAPGARVADALSATGGARNPADLVTLNQAQLVTDGQQIVVGAVAPSAQGKVSLNSATAKQLTELPGVGEATAAAIVTYREKNGPFSKVEDLEKVPGIGPAKLAKIKDEVTL